MYGAAGTMNFQPGPVATCCVGLRQSEATLLMKRLLKPLLQKHSAADPGVDPSSVLGPLFLALIFSSNIGDEVLFKEVLGFSAVLHGNAGSGKLAAAEDHILLDKSVVTAMHCDGPFQAIVYRVADKLKLISGIGRICWAPKMVSM